jgi:hypothetical protein
MLALLNSLSRPISDPGPGLPTNGINIIGIHFGHGVRPLPLRLPPPKRQGCPWERPLQRRYRRAVALLGAAKFVAHFLNDTLKSNIHQSGQRPEPTFELQRDVVILCCVWLSPDRSYRKSIQPPSQEMRWSI